MTIILPKKERKIKQMKALPENFEDLSNEWLNFKAYKVKESTIQKYKVIISTHILSEFGSIKITEMSTPLINKKMMELYQECKIKLSYSSIRCIFYIIKAIITYGVNNEYFTQVYFTFEFSKGNTNTKIQILSKPQEKTVFNQASVKKHPNNLGILLSLGTGMRIGEVCALSIEDINMKSRVISVKRTVQRLSVTSGERATELVVTSPKSPSAFRDIPIPDFLYQALSEYNIKDYSTHSYVLTNSNKPYDPRTLQYAFERMTVKELGHKLNFHCLRHTYATRCIETGIDIKTVSELLGHSDTSFTMNRYVHPSIETKKKAVKKLNSYWSDYS